MAGLFVDAALESAVESQGRPWRRLRLGRSRRQAASTSCPREECLEAFQWLAEEVRRQGDALVMQVGQFDGLSDAELMERFRKRGRRTMRPRRPGGRARNAPARGTLHERSGPACGRCSNACGVSTPGAASTFDAPEGGLLASRLGRMARGFRPVRARPYPAAPAAIETYCETRWVTRPRPHVDRLSCIWLIRRFINPQAVVRYSPMPEPGEVGFDMPHGEFTHRGHLCTFETMVSAFGLEDPSLQPMGKSSTRSTSEMVATCTRRSRASMPSSRAGS